jgi:hypothetical protein
MAPAAVAARSSSASKDEIASVDSTTAKLEGASISSAVGTAISKPLAAGRMVATSSKEVATPQIATDFFELFIIAVFTFCSPSIHL